MTIAETSAALGTQQAIFVWCEDSRSGFQFWKEIFAAIDKDIQVQSKCILSNMFCFHSGV